MGNINSLGNPRFPSPGASTSGQGAPHSEKMAQSIIQRGASNETSRLVPPNLSRRNITAEFHSGPSETESDQRDIKRDLLPRLTSYQITLLVFLICRQIDNQYALGLYSNREIEEPEEFDHRDPRKLDDLVLKSLGDKTVNYHLVRVERNEDQSKKITSADLLEEEDGDCSLAEAFFLYTTAKEDERFSDGAIKDLIIFNKSGFDLKELENNGIKVQPTTKLKNFLDMEGYQLTEGLLPKLKPILESDHRWASSIVKDETIKSFLNHLIFVVNQPNEKDLYQSICKEVGQTYSLNILERKDAYYKLMRKMIEDWTWKMKAGTFLSKAQIEKACREIKMDRPILFGYKSPSCSFSGRQEELNTLHDLMQTNRRVVISGLGGVGKTELARTYIYEHAQDYDKRVICIDCNCPRAFADSFRRLAIQLEISLKKAGTEQEKDLECLVQEVFELLVREKFLFVFDDVQTCKGADSIMNFLPILQDPKNASYILITSRQTQWPETIKRFPLDPFTPKDAIEFIKKELEIEDDEQEKAIIQLGEAFQYFPLALQQATQYIEDQHRKDQRRKLRNEGSEFGILDYLKRYEKQPEKLLKFEFPERSDITYSQTTLTTWLPTLDRIKEAGGHEALESLQMLAYLAPDAMIPTELLSCLIGEDWKRPIVQLKENSMVRSHEDPTLLSVHRLVQQVVRLTFKKREEAILRKVLKKFTGSAGHVTHVDHARSVWDYASEYRALVREFSTFPHKVMDQLSRDRRVEEALLFGTQALELLSNQLGPTHPNTLAIKKGIERLNHPRI